MEHLSRPAGRPVRYVAIGDSTTEGLEDPDGEGGYRGWADRLAHHLAAGGPVEYANLAVRGLKASQIEASQLAVALELEPDVATVVAGVNDVIRPSFSLDAVAGALEAMIAPLRASGVTVLTFTMPDLTAVLPLARLVQGRVAALNQRLRALCQTQGALLLDLERTPVAGDPRLWHHDRLHANSVGHERIGRGLAFCLGLPGHDETWADPLPAPARRSLGKRVREEIDWATRHLVPWALRHARGQSSSDGRGAKRPTLSRVEGVGAGAPSLTTPPPPPPQRIL